MANEWASQGARKTGPLSSRGMPGTASATHRAASGSIDNDSDMFEIRFKGFDGDFQFRVRVRAPKLLGVEAHGIKPLRILALPGSYGIRKDVRAMQSLHHADTAARIARQTRVRPWMNIFRAHAIADFELRGRRRRTAVRSTFRDLFHIGKREWAASQIFSWTQRPPGGDFVGVDEAALDQQVLIAQKPFLVVGAGQIERGRHQFNGITAGVDGPGAEYADGTAHRQHASFPRMMKYRLVGLGLDFAKPVHAAHIVNAVHQATSLGFFARPAPIMLSRVTNVAS